jgi:hypothetical protein
VALLHLCLIKGTRELPNENCKLRDLFSWLEGAALVLTGGSLVTNGRVTQDFRKEELRSNNSNDGNYLLLWGFSQS